MANELVDLIRSAGYDVFIMQPNETPGGFIERVLNQIPDAEL
jgi:cell division septation protein DedD